MSELPIIEAVTKYIKENNVLFCTPGHKGGAGFNAFNKDELINNIFKFDITEVEGLDNLHNPEGVIKESLQLLSAFYGSYKSYYLVNGSTLGNMIMLFSSFNEGDKVLIERCCHKSVYNAVIMKKLKPIFIKNVVSPDLGIPLSIDMDHFFQLINDEKDIKGIVITYPNYYGLCCNLELIIKECGKHGLKVLVDSAHGAHFGVSTKLPASAIKLGADMVVTSSHKTLPSLTQTAYLHISENTDVNKVDFYFKALSSTSPSYMFLCSLEYARFYLERLGKKDYDELIRVSDIYRNKINSINHIHIIGKNDIINGNLVYDMDSTRYIINLEKGFSGHLLLKYLRKNGIQGELSDESNVVLILSSFNKEWEFEKLYFLLKNCNFETLKSKNYDIVKYNIPELILNPFEAVNSNKMLKEYKHSKGCISAGEVTPYPPGIPILMPGEKITDEFIDAIEMYQDMGVNMIGITSDKLWVVDIMED
ncbi:MAG: aminotransferase class I/II-fold pyridoxal phosphate-dependent enzyme [Solirubrobacterales bacterium]